MCIWNCFDVLAVTQLLSFIVSIVLIAIVYENIFGQYKEQTLMPLAIWLVHFCFFYFMALLRKFQIFEIQWLDYMIWSAIVRLHLLGTIFSYLKIYKELTSKKIRRNDGI